MRPSRIVLGFVTQTLENRLRNGRNTRINSSKAVALPFVPPKGSFDGVSPKGGYIVAGSGWVKTLERSRILVNLSFVASLKDSSVVRPQIKSFGITDVNPGGELSDLSPLPLRCHDTFRLRKEIPRPRLRLTSGSRGQYNNAASQPRSL